MYSDNKRKRTKNQKPRTTASSARSLDPQTAHSTADALRQAADRARQRVLHRALAACMRAPGGGPRSYDSDALFWRLQRRFKPRTGYAYDPRSTMQRGTRRADALVSTLDLYRPGMRILEIGCGDAMTAQMLAARGHWCAAIDIEDRRDSRAGAVAFGLADVCAGVALAADQFDAVYSYNTFEHLHDPAAALDECVRVCRPGGRIYLEFGPLFASAWGLHAYKTVTIPYVQFLFSAPFIAQKLGTLGIDDLGRTRDALQPLNRWRVDQFRQLWQRPDCAIVAHGTTREYRYLPIVCRFGPAFGGRGLDFDDLTVKNLHVTLRKRAQHAHSGGS